MKLKLHQDDPEPDSIPHLGINWGILKWCIWPPLVPILLLLPSSFLPHSLTHNPRIDLQKDESANSSSSGSGAHVHINPPFHPEAAITPAANDHFADANSTRGLARKSFRVWLRWKPLTLAAYVCRMSATGCVIHWRARPPLAIKGDLHCAVLGSLQCRFVAHMHFR